MVTVLVSDRIGEGFKSHSDSFSFLITKLCTQGLKSVVVAYLLPIDPLLPCTCTVIVNECTDALGY